jgi:hypothetical protein
MKLDLSDVELHRNFDSNVLATEVCNLTTRTVIERKVLPVPKNPAMKIYKRCGDKFGAD